MDKTKISEIIPIGVVLPLLIILGVEFLISYGLEFYNSRQIAVIEEKKSFLTSKENEILNKLKNNEGYFLFSQYANISKLAKERFSFNLLLDKFNALMPKFLIIQNFGYDSQNNLISLDLKTKTWDDYLKLITYLKNNEYFSIEKANDPKFNEKEGVVEFQLTLKLKNKFFQKQ